MRWSVSLWMVAGLIPSTVIAGDGPSVPAVERSGVTATPASHVPRSETPRPRAILHPITPPAGLEIGLAPEVVTQKPTPPSPRTEPQSLEDIAAPNKSSASKAPVTASLRGPGLPAVVSKGESRLQAPRYTVLGQRDDSREATYALEGRGVEQGAGKRWGRYCEPPMERAGDPQCISRHAQPSTDRDHTLGYVGGGTPLHLFGECRRLDEGNVGMDYSGWLLQRKTWLMWSHGALHQGGAGRYETDGPRILPEK